MLMRNCTNVREIELEDYMRTSVVVAVIGLVGTVSAAAIYKWPSWSGSHPDRSAPTECPAINGRWHSDGNSITLDMVQSECNISSVFSGPTQSHVLKGSWAKGQYHFEIKRTGNGCTTTMYGTFVNISATEMTSMISGTDGKCELGANFNEQLLWRKL
jgi:hypothetical protein